MSDSDRRIFPVESVLALITGKEGTDVKEIAGYVAGRSIACDDQARAVAPYAAAWLARLYPPFTDLAWTEGQNWEEFVSRSRSALGENISLTPMDGRTQTLTGQALACLEEARNAASEQEAAAKRLEERVRQLEPLEARTAELQKKIDALEEKIKTMNADMGELRRQTVAFQGKLAIDHDSLLQTIKDSIKDGLKGMVVGGAGAAGAATAAEEPQAEEGGVPDGFGFGDSGANADGFGF